MQKQRCCEEVIVWFGRLTVEIVPVFSGAGQGMVTIRMAVRMEHPCHGRYRVTTETQRTQRLRDLCTTNQTILFPRQRWPSARGMIWLRWHRSAGRKEKLRLTNLDALRYPLITIVGTRLRLSQPHSKGCQPHSKGRNRVERVPDHMKPVDNHAKRVRNR
jgi:hypothetical protein